MVLFRAELFRIDEPGGWWFVAVPDEHAPDAAGSWGRAPVIAQVNGRTWATSAWRDRRRGWLLPVPARIRAGLEEGDEVDVVVDPDPERPLT